MQIDSNAMILRITIEKHAELQERVRAVLNARYQTAGRECGLLDVPVI